ncbi:MAG: trigger factor [Synergistaceae bacterium]|jgi:trigger factor|nr:trigger factor [Synergistaceae bacterium]
MKTELLGQEKNIVRIKVDFEAGEFMSSLGEAVRELTEKAKIPGFRKGHVPRKVLEMRFGKKGLYSEAIEKMLPGTIKQVVDDYDLETTDTPALDLNLDSIQEGQPFSCELAFEVMPVISLPELEDIEVERPRCPEVTEERIDEVLARLRTYYATLSPVDRAAAEGDVVSADCVTQVFGDGWETLDGQGSEAADINLSEDLRDEIRRALLGKGKGDQVEVELTIEPDHENKKLAGRKLRYSFTIMEVKERVLPEVGPDFYKAVTGAECESEEVFREKLREHLVSYLEAVIRDRVASAAVEQVVSRSELDAVPESLVNRQAEAIKERDIAESQKNLGLNLEEYLGRSDAKRTVYEESVRSQAADAVRRFLVLNKVGEKFGVTVADDELDAEFVRLASIYGVEPARLKAMFYKDDNRVLEMAHELRRGKIVQLIAEKVRIKDVDEVFDTDLSLFNAPRAEGGE